MAAKGDLNAIDGRSYGVRRSSKIKRGNAANGQHNEHETWANSSVGQRTISFDWNALCITVEEIVLTINWKRVGKEAERREKDH